MSNYEQVKRCRLTQELKQFKLALQEIACKASPFLSVELRIDICGMNIAYHIKATSSNCRGLVIEAVGNCEELLTANFINALNEYPEKLKQIKLGRSIISEHNFRAGE